MSYTTDTVVPKVIKILRAQKSKPITNKGIRNKLPINVQPATIRSAIHHIRVEGLLKSICASSRGYWIEKNKNNVKTYSKSLRLRAKEINAVALALEKSIA